jgi:Ni,Fe-hydrogenase I cytochrome b subunit
MDQTKRIKVYLYTRYERFWHWLQAAIIIFLMITGFEIHGTYTLMGYETAVKAHNFVGLSCILAFHHRGVASIHSHNQKTH